MFSLYLKKMKIKFLFYLLLYVFSSCSSSKQLLYLNDKTYPESAVEYPNYTIQPQDILKIDVHSITPEAALPYNKVNSGNVNQNITFCN